MYLLQAGRIFQNLQDWLPQLGRRPPPAARQDGLDDRDLRVVSSALRAASGLSQRKAGRSSLQQRWTHSTEASPFDFFAQHLGSIFQGELEGLHGQLGSVFEELERFTLPPEEARPDLVDVRGAEQLSRHQQPPQEVEASSFVREGLILNSACTRFSLFGYFLKNPPCCKSSCALFKERLNPSGCSSRAYKGSNELHICITAMFLAVICHTSVPVMVQLFSRGYRS